MAKLASLISFVVPICIWTKRVLLVDKKMRLNLSEMQFFKTLEQAFLLFFVI